jgi:hypothetical protein
MNSPGTLSFNAIVNAIVYIPTKTPNKIRPIKIAGVAKISLIPLAPILRKLQIKIDLQTPILGTIFPPRRDPIDSPTSPSIVVRVL